MSTIAKAYKLSVKKFELQYKHHLSSYHDWNQLDHAARHILFPENIGTHLSIDETSLTNGELYTVVTNKSARGKQGALVAMIKGTKTADIVPVLKKISYFKRQEVTEVTLDMAHNMAASVREVFFKAELVTDRFHVQQLVTNALQEVRIDLRREAIKEENSQIKLCRREKRPYMPHVYENGDTKKQLLARSRYVLFKPRHTWSESQKIRASILFREYPELKSAYGLSMMFRSCYEHNRTIPCARKSLRKWYEKVAKKNIDSFNTAAESIRLHETTILNYFINRSTNASAESFNAKLKGFRTLVRGVRDTRFFLFRVATLYG